MKEQNSINRQQFSDTNKERNKNNFMKLRQQETTKQRVTKKTEGKIRENETICR
jgi:hypothetical protein